jgi:flagellar hook-basal body complex protein FliE
VTAATLETSSSTLRTVACVHKEVCIDLTIGAHHFSSSQSTDPTMAKAQQLTRALSSAIEAVKAASETAATMAQNPEGVSHTAPATHKSAQSADGNNHNPTQNGDDRHSCLLLRKLF